MRRIVAVMMCLIISVCMISFILFLSTFTDLITLSSLFSSSTISLPVYKPISSVSEAYSSLGLQVILEVNLSDTLP